MKVHLRYLAYHIWPVKATLFASRRDIWSVDRIVPLSLYQEHAGQENILFLCDLPLELAQLAGQYSGVNILAFADHEKDFQCSDFPELNLLVVHKNTSKNEICDKINKIITSDINADLYLDLMEAVIKNAFWEHALMEMLARITGNPLAVLDTSLSLIMTSDSSYISSVQYENINYDLVQHSDPQGLNIFVDAHGHRFAVVPIEYHEFIFGFFLMFERNIILDDADGTFMRKLSLALALEIQKGNFSYISDSVNAEEFFVKMLSDEIISQRYIEKNSEIMGFSAALNGYNYIISFKLPKDIASYSTLVKRFLMRDLKKILNGLLCALKDEFIVMLFSGLPGIPFSQKTGQNLDQFLKSRDIQAGISAGFQGLDNIRTYYTQSINSIVLFNHIDNGKNYIITQDYPFFDLLLTVSGRTMMRSYISHKVNLLIQYDQQYHTKFLETLECYLKNCCNVKRAADELFLHRNTLLYRIKKIEDISGLDFSNSEDIFHSMMTLRILRFLANTVFPDKQKTQNDIGSV